MKRTFTFRIDDELWEKFHKIAELEHRSANAHLEHLVSAAVKSFEKENGEMPLDEEK